MADKPLFQADSARVIGKVSYGDNVTLWYSAVLRADYNTITIGNNSNIQDNVTCHVSEDYPLIIKDNVTIGHNAVVHGCTIEDNVLIGMGAIILNGAHIGANSIIGAHALVIQQQIIPPNSLVLGIPAKVVRKLSEKEIADIIQNAEKYVENGRRYLVNGWK